MKNMLKNKKSQSTFIGILALGLGAGFVIFIVRYIIEMTKRK